MGKEKKYLGGRRDGELIRIPYDLNALFPYIFKTRTSSLIYFSENIDVEPLLNYIEQKKEQGEELKFFQFFVAAVVKLLRERPALNRFVMGRRLYQRDYVSATFIAKQAMSDQAGETNVTVRFQKDDTFEDILKKVSGEIRGAKEGNAKDDDKLIGKFMRLPRLILMFVLWIIEVMDFFKGPPKFIDEVDPLRCSVYLANLGSVGIEAPYHHLFEWGTCSLFIAIGRIKPTPCVDENGNLVVKKMVEFKATLDDRISDGFYCARSLDLFKTYFADPAGLIESLGGNKET